MNTNLIAAYDRNRTIGICDAYINAIPWHIPEDLKFFKHMTENNIVVMGRNTFESLNGPLPDRLNIIASRRSSYVGENIRSVDKLEDIYAIAHAMYPNDDKDIYIIGGGSIYQEALDSLDIDNFYITIIDYEFEGNIKFPYVDWLSEYKFVSGQRLRADLPDIGIVDYGRYHFTTW